MLSHSHTSTQRLDFHPVEIFQTLGKRKKVVTRDDATTKYAKYIFHPRPSNFVTQRSPSLSLFWLLALVQSRFAGNKKAKLAFVCAEALKKWIKMETIQSFLSSFLHFNRRQMQWHRCRMQPRGLQNRTKFRLLICFMQGIPKCEIKRISSIRFRLSLLLPLLRWWLTSGSRAYCLGKCQIIIKIILGVVVVARKYICIISALLPSLRNSALPPFSLIIDIYWNVCNHLYCSIQCNLMHGACEIPIQFPLEE